MLIETQQIPGHVIASYANPDGGISVKKYNVAEVNGYGVYDYRICADQNDPAAEPNLFHYKNNLKIKKFATFRFDYDELREFLTKSIPDADKKELYTTKVPDMYAADIEINIGDGEIFPNPHLAEFEIDSIQITAPNLNTVTLTTNKRALQDDAQILRIEDALNSHYKDVEFVWTKTKRLKYSHILFETEKDMIEFWWKNVRDRLHFVSFWNGWGFDVPYLWNRSQQLGIDVGMGSPVGQANERRQWPRHRMITDYMLTVDQFAHDIWPRLSLALSYISDKILGIGKLEYEGSFKDLYHGPIETFMTYGAVDTVAMQLIHLSRNYSAGIESMGYYCKIAMSDVDKTTALVHAVIWDELYESGLINAEPYTKKEKIPYEGGYVKQPVRKFCMYPVGIDFSALYPRVIQSFNISFENFRGKVRDKEHAKQLLNDGYYVSINGNYYDNDKDYCLKRVEDKLLSERYAYKDLMLNIFQQVTPAIEKELKRRGIDPKKID